MKPRLLAPLLTALFALAVLFPAAASAWAPAQSATVHPGVQTYTDGSGQCTSNFIFTQGADVFIGQSAHCSGTGAATETNGCDAESLPLGTRVEIDGASVKGTMVYNSWIAMQEAGETDEEACAYNDFALVRVGAQHVGKVNPTVPFWGGPVGLRTEGTAVGDELYSFGNSSLRSGVVELAPKVGSSLGSWAGGWSHDVYTATPGVPGDSGSAFLDDEGRAMGTLSTLALAPFPGSNGVSDLAHELRFAQRFSGIDGLRLVRGTEPFSPVP